MKELIHGVKVTQAIAPAAGVAGTSAINGATLDMSGFEGVLMVITFGAITATAVTAIKAQQGAASNLSDVADLLGTGQAIADSDDEKVFYINLHKPRERYVRLAVTRGTANAVVASAEYFQYGARTEPIAAHGTGVAGEAHVSPAEGTA